MRPQRSSVSSNDPPPPYTEGRAPPSYTNTDDATTSSSSEVEEDSQVQPTRPTSTPAVLDLSARIPHIAPPVVTPHNAWDSSRTPLKFPNRPGRSYVRTGVRHTHIDMLEPNFTTRPMQYSQTNVSTTASRAPRRGRLRGCSSCVTIMIFIAIVVTVIVLVWKKSQDGNGHDEVYSAPVSTGGHLSYGGYTPNVGTGCGFFIFC